MTSSGRRPVFRVLLVFERDKSLFSTLDFLKDVNLREFKLGDFNLIPFKPPKHSNPLNLTRGIFFE